MPTHVGSGVTIRQQFLVHPAVVELDPPPSTSVMKPRCSNPARSFLVPCWPRVPSSAKKGAGGPSRAKRPGRARRSGGAARRRLGGLVDAVVGRLQVPVGDQHLRDDQAAEGRPCRRTGSRTTTTRRRASTRRPRGGIGRRPFHAGSLAGERPLRQVVGRGLVESHRPENARHRDLGLGFVAELDAPAARSRPARRSRDWCHRLMATKANGTAASGCNSVPPGPANRSRAGGSPGLDPQLRDIAASAGAVAWRASAPPATSVAANAIAPALTIHLMSHLTVRQIATFHAGPSAAASLAQRVTRRGPEWEPG